MKHFVRVDQLRQLAIDHCVERLLSNNRSGEEGNDEGDSDDRFFHLIGANGAGKIQQRELENKVLRQTVVS